MGTGPNRLSAEIWAAAPGPRAGHHLFTPFTLTGWEKPSPSSGGEAKRRHRSSLSLFVICKPKSFQTNRDTRKVFINSPGAAGTLADGKATVRLARE
ncbi:hypothetical protein Cadr_000014016 [Camelus dromedarius]|uniref:Uncharacterized protein n=1 Tax=Camelus dromedarius TaxID=9838 RepID=A0A5N4DAA5_CAMDR|nr:hypothetical protein Cadr_000014016 [Camelus dromedarius]